MPSIAGNRIGKYDVVDEVGSGGMAVVYRGIDRVLDREVAVKILHSHLAGQEESRLRLQREALAVAKLRHENILEIFDYSGSDAGDSYIVTEFIHGPTLRSWMDSHAPPRPVVAVMIVHRLCRALSHAHDSGIVHRDLKPENVMIRRADGCLKLMDFGIAQVLDKQKLTLTGQLLGSPAYMAPELVTGRPLDVRTDLFSLGIMLYQLTTGELPFTGRNPHEVLNRIVDGVYTPPSEATSLVDPDLEGIIARALSANPDDRYQSAEAMAEELESYLVDVGVEPTTDEIAAYFSKPETYQHELDQRVSTALVANAETAAAEGHNARAIRLLGRVLELDPNHPTARQTLERLRARSRRTRQMLWAGGGLSLLGIAAAGVMLLEPGLRALVGPDDAAVPAELTTAEPEPPPLRKEPVVPVAPAGRAPATSSATPPVSPKPKPTSTVRASSRGKMLRPPKTLCHLKLGRVPSSVIDSLTLIIPTGGQKITGRVVDFEFSGEKATVTVDGQRYGGTRTVTRAECLKRVVALDVAPKPVSLEFRNAPTDMVVICRAGCPKDFLNREKLQDQFQGLGFTGEGSQQKYKLTLKAKGYRERTVEHSILPGRNRIPVNLEPL